MNKHKLNLAYKGERDYLHGTDIIPVLFTLTGPVEQISIQIHRMMSRPLFAYVAEEAEIGQLRSTGKLCAVMVYVDSKEGRTFMVVTEDENSKIMERNPYDEKPVTTGFEVIGQKINQKIPGEGTFIERVVALNKILLNHVIGNNSWLFTRIDLNYAPLEPRSLSIELSRVMGGQSFKSVITGDGEQIGSIFFSKKGGG